MVRIRMAFVNRPHLSLVLFDVNLVAQYNEGEVLGVMRAGLDEELVPPAIESFERLCAVHIIDEYAAVGTPVESHTE